MSLTTPMKVVLAVIIIAIIGLGFWMLDWQGKQQQLTQLEKTLADKKADKEKMEKDLQKVDELVKVNNDLKKQLEDVVKIGFTPEKETEFVPNYLSGIEELIAKVQREKDPTFELTSLTPGRQQTSSGPGGGAKGGEPGKAASPAAAQAAVPAALASYPTRTFQMTLKGRYETVIDFLDRLGQLELQRLVTVDKVSLAGSVSDKDKGSPMLTITLPLTAYLRTGGGQQ